MATKNQVVAVLEKQGAQWEVEQLDPFTFSAWLPDGLMWDSGYGLGLMTQELDPSESMATFWASVLAVVDAPIVPQP